MKWMRLVWWRRWQWLLGLAIRMPCRMMVLMLKRMLMVWQRVLWWVVWWVRSLHPHVLYLLVLHLRMLLWWHMCTVRLVPSW